MLYGLQMEIVIDPLDKKLTKKSLPKALRLNAKASSVLQLASMIGRSMVAIAIFGVTVSWKGVGLMLKNSVRRRVATWPLSPQRPSMSTFLRKREKEAFPPTSGLEGPICKWRVFGGGQMEAPGNSLPGNKGNQTMEARSIAWFRLATLYRVRQLCPKCTEPIIPGWILFQWPSTMSEHFLESMSDH